MNPAMWPYESPTDDPFDRDKARALAATRGIDAPTFDRHLHALLRGDIAAATALGVVRPLTHNDESRPSPTIASVAECAQMATDMAPHLGGDGVVRILGPHWLDFDAFNPRDVRALTAALAASNFMEEEDDHSDRSPFGQWCRRKPIASIADRERFRAIDREPHRLCTIEARGERWTVADALDGERFEVDPTPLAHLLCDDGPALFARLAPTGDVRVATVGWVLPCLPNVEALRAWRLVRVWLHRLEDRRATVEAVMRRSPWVREVVRATLAQRPTAADA